MSQNSAQELDLRGRPGLSESVLKESVPSWFTPFLGSKGAPPPSSRTAPPDPQQWRRTFLLKEPPTRQMEFLKLSLGHTKLNLVPSRDAVMWGTHPWICPWTGEPRCTKDSHTKEPRKKTSQRRLDPWHIGTREVLKSSI